MAAACYNSDCHHTKGMFEMFVRKLPRNRSYLVAGGLEQVLYFLVNVKFEESSKLSYLKWVSVRFKEEELSYLKSLEVFKYVREDFF
jgi:nicotinate phosphoribosyltransferase